MHSLACIMLVTLTFMHYILSTSVDIELNNSEFNHLMKTNNSTEIHAFQVYSNIFTQPKMNLIYKAIMFPTAIWLVKTKFNEKFNMSDMLPC